MGTSHRVRHTGYVTLGTPHWVHPGLVTLGTPRIAFLFLGKGRQVRFVRLRLKLRHVPELFMDIASNQLDIGCVIRYVGEFCVNVPPFDLHTDSRTQRETGLRGWKLSHCGFWIQGVLFASTQTVLCGVQVGL